MTQPIDDRWRSIIKYTRLPKADGVYIVGSFARSVTVYSQQVRALNVVDALCGMGHLSHATRVAVVGGGIAGITCATALVTIGTPVVVYEKELNLIPLQFDSDKRYLHPHIYDWPLTSVNDVDARLPVMNWTANFASQVAGVLKKEWENVKGNAPEETGVVHSEVRALERVENRWSVSTADATDAFDVVLVCVGFGVEPLRDESYPYWADLPLNDPAVHSQRWLISGAGDGALTDLMRLCITNFTHRDTLRLVVDAIESHDPEYIPQLRRRVTQGIVGARLFDGLPIAAIAKVVTLRKDTVSLNAREEEIFGSENRPPRSAVLNRLITQFLIAAGTVKLQPGRFQERMGKRPDYQVRFSEPDDTLSFGDVLVRHGPDGPFGKAGARKAPGWMASLERDVIRVGRLWDQLYTERQPDPTISRDHWVEGMFGNERIAPDFRKHSAIAVYSTRQLGKESIAFANSINAALINSEVRSALRETGITTPDDSRVYSLRLEDALRDPRAVCRTIRSLCEAPIAVFDATTESPALMFLLGIRGVVRRGVSVVVRVGELGAADWRRLAFNLRELRLVSLPNRNSLSSESKLKAAVVEGLKLYARHPLQYSDLPAFTALRNLGGDKDDYAPRKGAQQVLVLCPFDEDYSRECWPEIQRALRDHWADGTDGPARRVIDLQSPELISRRLFEAIRRDVECVVDLSLNKPNVFFELGSRLVANENGARVVRCLDLVSEQVAGEACPQLDELVGTKPYRVLPDATGRVSQALSLADAWPGGTLTSKYWFTIASMSVDPRQESGGRGIEELLWDLVVAAIGRDHMQAGGYPAFYSDSNDLIQAQIRRFSFEALFAYLLLVEKLPRSRQDPTKISIALGEMRSLLESAPLSDSERARLRELIDQLEIGSVS